MDNNNLQYQLFKLDNEMKDVAVGMGEFSNFRRYGILVSEGTVSGKETESRAYLEYGIYDKTQRIDSDFEKAIERLKGGIEHE